MLRTDWHYHHLNIHNEKSHFFHKKPKKYYMKLGTANVFALV